MTTGKFIAILGINNIGGTTQSKRLIKRIASEGLGEAQYIKYPVYDCEPVGPMINAFLREGNPMDLTPREAQMLYALNRHHFQPELEATLAQGTHVVAEDYKGTGIAWGIASGGDREFMKDINTHLRDEDCVILLDGKRFLKGKEKDHTHENNFDLTEKCRQMHQELAEEFGWHVVNANRDIEEVHNEIWGIVEPVLRRG